MYLANDPGVLPPILTLPFRGAVSCGHLTLTRDDETRDDESLLDKEPLDLPFVLDLRSRSSDAL